MASEQVLDTAMRRHVLTSELPFQAVLDGIYAGISQPDIGALFAKLAAIAVNAQALKADDHEQIVPTDFG